MGLSERNIWFSNYLIAGWEANWLWFMNISSWLKYLKQKRNHSSLVALIKLIQNCGYTWVFIGWCILKSLLYSGQKSNSTMFWNEEKTVPMMTSPLAIAAHAPTTNLETPYQRSSVVGCFKIAKLVHNMSGARWCAQEAHSREVSR